MPILDWLNKDKAVTTAQQVPYRILEPVPELRVGDAAEADNSGNMLIQGDNLEALKSLLPLYAGKVKCIFIDPPYNTKSAFEHYDDNLEHSVWLSMMYPRLEMLRELLDEFGSIWISIDDNESHYLKVVMDEVFGRKNFVASFVWEKDKGGRGDADVSLSHDYIHLYAKNRQEWAKVRNLMPRTSVQMNRFRNPDNDPRGAWRQGDDGTAKSGTDKQRFDIELPSGRTVKPKQGRYWAFSQQTFLTALAEGRVYFGKDGDRLPIIKRYVTEVRDGVAPRTWWAGDDVGTNQSAKRDHLRKLLPNIDSFATPKPEGLVERILYISSNIGDLVLDSFLGSGTTAAVAHKMGRRYIGIEMGDHAVTHCQPRLQKVVDGEQGGVSKAVSWQGGGGCNFYRLGEPVFDEYGHIREGVSFAAFAQYLWFLETGTPLMTKPDSPLLGEYQGTAYYLLYNGILGDRRPQGGNVLTSPILSQLPLLEEGFDGPKIIFGESSRLGDARLQRENIVFKQIPYEVGAV